MSAEKHVNLEKAKNVGDQILEKHEREESLEKKDGSGNHEDVQCKLMMKWPG